jgi:Carboxypeptidase regulatory-like domain/TonB-dependent Receptor Plug Domain
MQTRFKKSPLGVFALLLLFGGLLRVSYAQTGNSSTISGTVVDPSGGVVGGATVTIHDPVSGYERSAKTASSGDFSFPNVPFNPYYLTVAAKGFAPYVQDVEVRSTVPVSLKISLQLAGAITTVTVHASDLLENTPTTHTDIDRSLFNKLPLESQSSSVSSLITLSAPGVAADSNGLFHGIGAHASNSFSLDGQPVTDQQSKVFSNQIPLDAIQSVEVIEGAPPAQYGDKTSLVIDVTTRSGEGVTTPHGSVTSSYGTFGTSNAGFDLAYGGQKWGNYIAANGLRTGRFLDGPEFTVFHDKGNEENLFDRVDYRLTNADSLQFNVGYTRSWFQTPDSFDNLNTGLTEGSILGTSSTALVGPTDQRSKILTFNIAPTWTRLISSTTVFTLGAFVRRDAYNYYPSNNPFADTGPPSLQRETVGQGRTLTNTGVRSDIAYVKGMHNLKAGITYQQTFLTEDDRLGVVDFTLNAPCLTLATAANPNVPVPGFTDPISARPPTSSRTWHRIRTLQIPPCTPSSIRSCCLST